MKPFTHNPTNYKASNYMCNKMISMHQTITDLACSRGKGSENGERFGV